MTATCSIETPRHASGAIAIVRLHADDLDAALADLALPPCPVAQSRLANILGVDRGLIVRWSADTLDLCIHGGRGVLQSLLAALADRHIPEREPPSPRAAWPEARDDVEAHMLGALARAASPLAVDLLLQQPARWRAHQKGQPLADANALRHLLTPPLVVIWGPPNIGKSTLLNALAREQIGLVADMPGTTRDAVGAAVTLDGLVVRMLDAPGITTDESDPLVAEAVTIARQLIENADLILSCADATTTPITPPANLPHLRLALRADLGLPTFPHDAAVSAHSQPSLNTLAHRIRQTLVPDEALNTPHPWRFW